jgi:hypothetical protein
VRGEDVLHVLQDVEWVVGSFVASSDGELILSLMPPEFGTDELKRTTSRLASIVRCAELCDLGVEQCEFSLNRYQLLLRHFRGGLLCVMVEAPVNRRALEMATLIALESLPPLVDALTQSTATAGNAAPERAMPDVSRSEASRSEATPAPRAPDAERDPSSARPTTSESGVVTSGEIDLEIPPANEKRH